MCDTLSCPPTPLQIKMQLVGMGAFIPWMLAVFSSALGQWPAEECLQVGKVAGEEAFGNQLVEIMVFTSSQLSLGRYFYSFTWLVFSFSELAHRMLFWVLFCFETVSQSDERCPVPALIFYSSHTYTSQPERKEGVLFGCFLNAKGRFLSDFLWLCHPQGHWK